MVLKNINSTDRKNSSLIKIIKGSIIAVIISLIGLLVFSLVLAYTNISDIIINPIIISIISISILIGSIISSKNIKTRGLLNGGLVGLIYILVIYFLSSIILNDFSINIFTIISFLASIICGIVGGIIGVNL